jgi:hypothetical protein
MNSIRETKEEIIAQPLHWRIWLMDFVDDFRYYKDIAMISEPFELTDDKVDALIASTVESLCDEAGFDVPEWIENIAAAKEPYFVSGIENLKATALVESPLRFRIRQVFVHENFLTRV